MPSQQSVPLTINSTVPVRAGSYSPPFRIINTSLSATVWVGDNSSVGTNNGTPIAPGTSVLWSHVGELWIVLGTDTQSATTGEAPVILSYNVEDWQPNPIAIGTQVALQLIESGILTVDDPTVLLSGTVLGSGLPNTVTADITKYQSITCKFSCANTAGGTGTVMSVSFYGDGQVLSTRAYTMGANAASPKYLNNNSLLGEITINIPCIGDELRLSFTSQVPPLPATDINYQVIGSYRTTAYSESPYSWYYPVQDCPINNGISVVVIGQVTPSQLAQNLIMLFDPVAIPTWADFRLEVASVGYRDVANLGTDPRIKTIDAGYNILYLTIPPTQANTSLSLLKTTAGAFTQRLGVVGTHLDGVASQAFR